MEKVKILIVDDEASIRSVLSASLRDEGYDVEVAADGPAGLDAMVKFQPDVVLLDIWMPEMDGIAVLKKAKDQNLPCEFIIMSGHGTIETAVQATRLGAWDFFEKPVSLERILILLKNIISYREERAEKKALLNKLRKNIAIIGDSPAIKSVKERISKVAPTESWVLVSGQNGTGKDLIVQNIHYLSSRAGRAFIKVNCAAIPEELMESELFGYEKAAFTNVQRGKKGKLDFAHRGTLFLDEIAHLSLKAQTKLLRILQEGRFTRAGGNELVDVDVRVIASTSKDLKQEISEGRFREDLYYRLNVIPIEAPLLAERSEDIPALISHFSEQMMDMSDYKPKEFNEEAMAALKSYKWPGNVRELQNFVERVYILIPEEKVHVQDLQYVGLPLERAMNDMDFANFREARAHFEREFLKRKIQEHNGNISKTAESIGLERSYLHRKIKTYGLDH